MTTTPPSARPRAVVVGCGVIGLTTAIRLLEAGWLVDVWGDRPPSETTSAVAAAIWFPYRVGPADRVAAWGFRTYDALVAIARDPATADAGVRLMRGLVLGEREPSLELKRQLPPGSWEAGDEPASSHSAAWALRVPVIDMSVHLAWLERELIARGGRPSLREVRSLDEAADNGAGDVRAVVNCTGLGARALLGDTELTPVRGQVVRVRNPGLDAFVLDDRDPHLPTYVIPRGNDCILGGTADVGAWDERPDMTVAAAIVERCVALEPRLRGVEVLEHRIGLRPGRGSVRLEVDSVAGRRSGTRLVHNYGHGGAGVTLAWGCADEVVTLLGGGDSRA